MTGHHTCPHCAAPMIAPSHTPCAACTTPIHDQLCRHCGHRMSLPHDQHTGAHLECDLHHHLKARR